MPHPMIITAISSPFIAFTSFLLLGLLFLWFPVFLWLSCFLFPASLLLGVKKSRLAGFPARERTAMQSFHSRDLRMAAFYIIEIPEGFSMI